MAKAKQRRIKKELEKLRRTDSHIEFLVLAQDLPLTPELQRETEQAWREVQRRTLRTRKAFNEFCASIPVIRNVPRTPELDFLLSLRDLLNGTSEVGDALAATGLSAPYQAARQALRAAIDAPLDWPGIEGHLSLLAGHPEKITRKHYQDLARYFANTILYEPLLALGEGMGLFRKLNHKTNLQKPLSDRLLDDLDIANRQVSIETKWLPPSLRHLLFLPFAMQIVLYLRHCDEKPATFELKRLLQSVSTVFLQGAEHLLTPELQKRLFTSNEKKLSSDSLKRMEQDFSAADFEGKLVLLRDLRQQYSAKAFEEKGNAFFTTGFQDEEEIWRMERMLLRFHRQVLKDIGRRLSTRPPRERRELAAVMAPILTRDIGMLLPVSDYSQPLADLLKIAAELGFLEVRLSVMAGVLSLRAVGKGLVSLVARALREAPAPTLADLQWIMEGHGSSMLQCPIFLTALFDKIRDDDALIHYLAKALREEVTSNVVMHTFLPEITAAARLGGDVPPSFAPLGPTVIGDLLKMANDIGPLASLAAFLELFPKGVIEVENLGRWLESVWGGDGSLFIDTALLLITCTSETSGILRHLGISGVRFVSASVAGKLNLPARMNDFLREHADDFRQLPLGTMQMLVQEIFPYLAGQIDYASLLIKTYNALCARIAAGEKEFIPLRNTLNNRLRALATNKRKPKRPPKYRR